MLAVWIVGVVRLFQKRRLILGLLALGGIIVPFILPVGLVGWVIPPNRNVHREPPSE